MTALRSELMRLRSDLALLGFLGLTALASAALLLQRASQDAVLVQVALLTALYGTVRYTLTHRNGITTRAVLLGHRVPALTAATAVTALGGAVTGAAAAAVLCARTVDATALLAVPVGATGAAWGLFIGVAVRNYFLAPTVLFTVHIGSALAMESWPTAGRLLPFGSLLSAVSPTRPDLLPPHLGALVYLTWVLLAGTAAWALTVLRDVE